MYNCSLPTNSHLTVVSCWRYRLSQDQRSIWVSLKWLYPSVFIQRSFRSYRRDTKSHTSWPHSRSRLTMLVSKHVKKAWPNEYHNVRSPEIHLSSSAIYIRVLYHNPSQHKEHPSRKQVHSALKSQFDSPFWQTTGPKDMNLRHS